MAETTRGSAIGPRAGPTDVIDRKPFSLIVARTVSQCTVESEFDAAVAALFPSPGAGSPSTLAGLLGQLEEFSTTRSAQRPVEDRLVRSRLGTTTALFTALRGKHAPTARHSLRVALRCSLVGELVGLTGESLDCLEVAALLHDVGKIAVPDYLLDKAGPLLPEEMAVLRTQRSSGLEILSACETPAAVMEIVEHYPTRFDGLGRSGNEPSGHDIPYGARILAIADAFDAMTTDRVYRPAMSRERAVAELFASAGTQFDPELVEKFCWLSPQTEAQLQRRVSQRWLETVSWNPSLTAQAGKDAPSPNGPSDGSLARFQQRLLDGMNDAVIFVDPRWRIALWNQGAERLTGITAESVLEREWHNSLLDLRDPEGNLFRENRCPVRQVLGSGQQLICRATAARSSGDRVSVELHVIPVNDERERLGAILLLRDASSEMHLEARVQDLSEQATTDPLTGTSNRAEFDREHASLVEKCLAQRTTCSIILCDLDRFKEVNDHFGHQAGDAVLIQFARLLQRFSRSEDLVARYGGEEFVVLCPECDNTTAARRAEQLRSDWARMPQMVLDQKTVTASFGVTELQAGDTAETMLRRADRALYQAKDGGRNQVVQLGAGFSPEESTAGRGWRSWWRRRPPRSLIQRTLVTSVPLNVAAEKIRGFIADHEAEIVSMEENHVELTVNVHQFEPQRRRNDRPAILLIDLEVEEVTAESLKPGSLSGTHTVARVTIRPRRERDRRSRVDEQAALILASLKAYLVAQDIADV